MRYLNQEYSCKRSFTYDRRIAYYIITTVYYLRMSNYEQLCSCSSKEFVLGFGDVIRLTARDVEERLTKIEDLLETREKLRGILQG